MKKGLISGIILLGAVVGAGFGITCIEIIPTGTVGVQYSMSGGVKDDILTQGWNFVSPTIKVSKFRVASDTLYMSADEREGSKENDSFDVVTKDGKMNVDFEMSYSFDSDKVVDVCEKYGLMDGQDIISTKIRGKIKTLANEVTSQYSTLDAHMTKKGELNRALTTHLQDQLALYGVNVESCTFSQTRVDASIEAAITERSKAAQEVEAEKQKQEKAKLEAETKRIQAQGEADKKLIEAQAQADANKMIEQSITQELIDMKEAEARMHHGWITVQGGTPIVDATEE